jgi:hypothetical protein
MRLVRSACAVSFVCCTIALAAGPVGAQDFGGIEQAPQYSRGFNTAVRERLHPEWAPIDLDFGGLTLQPQISVTSLFNDNEKYATTDPKADVSFRIQPAFSLGSNWSRNGFGLQAFVAQTEYVRDSEDNSTEYGATATGHLDIQEDFTIDLRGGDQRLVLARSDPDVPIDTLGPVEFNRQELQATVTKTLPVFQLQGVIALRNENYNPVALPDNAIYDASGRNGTYASYSGRVSYGVSPAVAVFVGALFNQGFRPKVQNLNEDAQGFNLAGGVNFDLSRLARGELALGYLYQDYSTPNTPSDSGFAFSANLQYFPTQLTTISIIGERQSAPSSVAGSPGGISLDGSVTIDHELLRNLILSAGGQVGQVQYRNFLVNGLTIPENRTDVEYGGTLGATYLMNRLVSLDLAYTYRNYSSTDALRRSYTANTLALTLRLTR